MSRTDEEAIRKIIVEMTEASNKNDAKAATRMYAQDADFVTVRDQRVTGRAEMEQRLSAIFANSRSSYCQDVGCNRQIHQTGRGGGSCD